MAHASAPAATSWHLDSSYARLPKIFFSLHSPAFVKAPRLVVLNRPLAEALGLDPRELASEGGVAVLAGNRLPAGAEPLAQAYAGHQFGHFTMLGDGRALLLGEQLTPGGSRFDIQLKGSGRTPYSRRGDGRAALGPMLREYIISEAMHALGIPTTRSLAVVATGEPVFRETVLPGAVLTRVAASHLRVGTFEFAAEWGSEDDLRALADYALERHYPDLPAGDGRHLALLHGVVACQAALIARWMLVGFIHGVMNTDNMTISGETIDYGPCAFMNAYDPATVFSSIDAQGRYAYGNQPLIAGWNLARFAETLLPLLHPDRDQAVKIAQEAVAAFPGLYHSHWLAGMRAKLGLSGEEEGDDALVKNLLDLMHQHRADYTNSFRALTDDTPPDAPLAAAPEFARWQSDWQARLGRQPGAQAAARQLMQSANPAVIPRNHRVEEALAAAVQDGDYTVLERLLAVLARPYDPAAPAEYRQPPDPSALPYRTFCGT